MDRLSWTHDFPANVSGSRSSDCSDPFFWIKLGADVRDLATNRVCFSKDHLLFSSRKKCDTTWKHLAYVTHQTDHSVLNYKTSGFILWLFLFVLPQLEAWRFSEIISAKFIDCFYEPVHTRSQWLLCITCSLEVEMQRIKNTINMKWLYPRGTMNMLRDLLC